MKRFAYTRAELITVIIISGFLFGLFIGPFVFETPFFLLLGWIWGLQQLVTELKFVHEPAAIRFGILAFLLLPFVFHLFVAPISKRLNKQWTFKKSFVVSSLIVLIAGAGIATVGGIHEIIWLFGGKEYFIESGYKHFGYRVRAISNLKRLGTNINNYNDKNEHLPFGGTILDDGQLGHGWMAQILPYCEQQKLYEKIDFTKSWNDPVNAPVFREQLHEFLSFHFRQLPEAERIDPNGFIKTDYTANQFVLPVGKSLRFEDITDGVSNTVLAGEAVQNLRPWGSPLNARDLKLGINKSPYGFGSKHVGVVNFLLCDGNVKFFNENTDSKILEAYATPNGNENVKLE